MTHYLIFDGVPNLAEVTKTLPVNGTNYLLMQAPFQLQGLDLGIDAFLQLNDSILGHRYIPGEDDKIYTNQVYKLPDWVKYADDEVFLALTPSTSDYLKIYAVSYSSEVPGVIEPPLVQGLIVKYYGAGVQLHQEVHQGAIDFDWGESPPQVIVDAGVGNDWEIVFSGIFKPFETGLMSLILNRNDSSNYKDGVELILNGVHLYNRFYGSKNQGGKFGNWSELQRVLSREQIFSFELKIKGTPPPPNDNDVYYKYQLQSSFLEEEGYPPKFTPLTRVPPESFYHYLTEVV